MIEVTSNDGQVHSVDPANVRAAHEIVVVNSYDAENRAVISTRGSLIAFFPEAGLNDLETNEPFEILMGRLGL